MIHFLILSKADYLNEVVRWINWGLNQILNCLKFYNFKTFIFIYVVTESYLTTHCYHDK